MCGRIATLVLVAAGFAGAQGKPTIAEQLRGGTANQQIRDGLCLKGSAGAGYVQQGFLDTLKESLGERVGEKRAAELMGNLKQENLTPQEVLYLMNGKMTESQLAGICQARKSEADQLEEAVEEAVDEKDRKCFFGILVVVVVCDRKCEDGDFLKHMLKGMEQMDQAGVKRLMRGDVSTGTIGETFGFDDKAMCKAMQDALNQLRSSPFVNHPMCESMGLGEKGKFNPEDFPKPAEGMPGCGGEFKDGEAGGLPFDMKLPPMPFAGENMGFPGCGEEKPAE
jgi:hypothetical protein